MSNKLRFGLLWGFIILFVFGAYAYVLENLEILKTGSFYVAVAFLWGYSQAEDDRPRTPAARLVEPNKNSAPVKPKLSISVEESLSAGRESALEGLKAFSSRPPTLPETTSSNLLVLEPGQELKAQRAKDDDHRLYFTLNGKLLPVLVVESESRTRWRTVSSETVAPLQWYYRSKDLAQLIEEAETPGLRYSTSTQAYHAELDESWDLELCDGYLELKYVSDFDDSP